MKLATKKDLHLTYCSNIHPGESWGEVKNNLQQYIPLLKAKLAPSESFGIGLRLAEIAAQELLEANNLAELKAWLKQENLYVFTLNGFPYGSFHHQVVKDKVYAPDWTKVERLDYTLKLMQILATLMPHDMDGGISTLPLSYKPWWHSSREQAKTFYQSSIQLAKVVAKMAAIAQETGKVLHLDLEPEPDGLLENTTEVIDFFQNWLFPVAGNWLQQELAINQEIAESLIIEHIRVCYDTCHFALEYEEPQSILERFQQAGIKIGKVQLSSAIKIAIPQERAKRQLIIDKLTPFAESTYLHQVIAQNSDRCLQRYRDLTTALPDLLTTTAQEWRTHFHVPIFIRDYQLFESTQGHIKQLLKLLPNHFVGHHLEIETYTWEVLPPAMKLDILTSIEREYQWVLSTMTD